MYRLEQESNLKSSYDDEFIRIAEARGLGTEARAAYRKITERRDRASRNRRESDAAGNERSGIRSRKADGSQGSGGRGVNRPLFSARPRAFADGLYNALEQAVETRLPARFSAAQAIGTVEGTAGVKAEKIKWSGFRQLVERLARGSSRIARRNRESGGSGTGGRFSGRPASRFEPRTFDQSEMKRFHENPQGKGARNNEVRRIQCD